MRHTIRNLGFGLLLFAIVGPQNAAAQAPPVTLWRFLGIPQAAAKVNAQLFNRRGNTPRLESKPPLKPIADPANMAPDMPKPIQAAAKIKQAEDLAPQKKKAIKYLAEIGCGCYDKQGEVTDALVAAMDDCTESVRGDAVEAIKTAASEDPCCNCGSKCCCNEKILKKLAELAYQRGPDGCYIEPSQRVREAAVEALMVCCTTQEPIEVLDEEKKDGSGIERPENGGLEDGPPPPPSDVTDPVTLNGPSVNQFSLSTFIDAGTAGERFPVNNQSIPVQQIANTTSVATLPEMQREVVAEKIAEVIPRRGEVTYVNQQDGLAHVKFDAMGKVPEQTNVRAYHKFLFKTSDIGEYTVVTWSQGEAVIRKADGLGIGKLARGDTIIVK